MIYTVNNNRQLNFKTPLIEYIRSKYLYNNENLIYSTKYSSGTFSITNPTSTFSNCCFINGYPHFDIPLEICLEEIQFFLNDENMYENNFYIRYGDTHPHKIIPKLAQVRNLLVENSFSNMIGQNACSFYGLGDISLKSLSDLILKNNINISPLELLTKILNNDIPITIYSKLEKYDLHALEEISKFSEKLGLKQKKFLIESKLYENQELYSSIKNNPNYFDELRNNGELKYSLQELMVIKSLLKTEDDILFNIIGANQISHILKVEELLTNSYKVDNRFLTYEICRNAENRNIDSWSIMLQDFIEQNCIKINSNFIDYQDLLKILIIINNNDLIIDFGNMEKYKSNIMRFISIIESFNDKITSCNIKFNNDLICKMALVGYYLNRSIEMGNQNYFYKYIFQIVYEFEKNHEKYFEIYGLYQDFIIKCFERIGYKKIRELKK